MEIVTRFINNFPPYMNDVPEVVRAFYPYIVINNDAENYIDVECEFYDTELEVVIKSNFSEGKHLKLSIINDFSLEYKKVTKRFVKTNLYAFCKELTGVKLPYGSLTGVRPTKMYYDLIGSEGNIKERLIGYFDVSSERADLIEEVVNNQVPIFNHSGEGIDVFVNIPFCPTRCRYCSFISTEIGRIKKRIPEYVECVSRELEEIRNIVERDNLTVRSVYFGGGTPTSLEADDLRKLLSFVQYGTELTVEAGRPDSITREKLQALSDMNVTRISINPQTFKQSTLKILGRAHSVEQIYYSYALSREFDFDVNMDLIAGLPEESYEDFVHSIDECIKLAPENITVHTLSIKRGSTLNNENAHKVMDGTVKKMVDYSRNVLKSNGYGAYYMYRQKNMADNLENVGYAKLGKACIYNVDYMEETNTILSAGAGAVSKFVYKNENRIERNCNAKGFEEYIRRKQI